MIPADRLRPWAGLAVVHKIIFMVRRETLTMSQSEAAVAFDIVWEEIEKAVAALN